MDNEFLYQKDNIDCSEIAKKFGGGGHAQAAGASFKTLPDEFINQIKLLQKENNKNHE